MAIDQYGQHYWNLGAHPRKELLGRLDKKHASKMYIDRNGVSKHIGYIIGKHWLTIFNVSEWVGKN